MFEPAAGPVKSARKFQLLSGLSLQGQVNRLRSSFELVGDRCLLSCLLFPGILTALRNSLGKIKG